MTYKNIFLPHSSLCILKQVKHLFRQLNLYFYVLKTISPNRFYLNIFCFFSTNRRKRSSCSYDFFNFTIVSIASYINTKGLNKKSTRRGGCFSEIEYYLRLEVFRNSNVKCSTKIKIEVFNFWSIVIIV